ncbi:MAG: sigma-70 family RNA polymerase sigma factor, partial [Gemmatimonadetes bacterium]|nr:sigma-70 family RNA polymerase sigma factor [Gemmatimonadota bacterium]
MPTDQPPDRAVIARIASGDERALGELYDRHAASAYGLARAIVGEDADAEEVVADAFVQLWRSATLFDPERGSVAAWLAMITRTRALDLLRSRRRRARALERASVLDDAGLAAPMASPAGSPEHAPERSEARGLVTR